LLRRQVRLRVGADDLPYNRLSVREYVGEELRRTRLKRAYAGIRFLGSLTLWYLFEGKVWIDSQDFAVVRIAGHPAKKLSFRKDETFVQVRMYGQKVLTIEHQRYTVAGGRNTEESVQTTEN
jgi:hypothetical protein